MKKLRIIFLLAFLCLLVYLLPPIRSRINTRLYTLKSDILYALNPPEEVVFVPQNQSGRTPPAAAGVLEPTPQPTPTLKPTQVVGATDTPALPATWTPAAETVATQTPMPTPTATSTQPPSTAVIDDIVYQHQHGLWNYCGPANVAMVVSYWGPEVDRQVAGAYLRGTRERSDDKNVNPAEMQTYVQNEAELRMLVRPGGHLDLLKRLVAAGFPVIVEKGFELEAEGWMGHYLLVNGYDDDEQVFIAQDSYRGANTRYSYEAVAETWRAFNYLFLVAYSAEREEALQAAVGPWWDETWATEQALEVALEEVAALGGRDQYFAQFNVGTSLLGLQQYAQAGAAYDTAFALYGELDRNERPWRMLWYQTGPYEAYYHAGRYTDVVNLANTTLDTMHEPILEESYYWRALAKEALGNVSGALADAQTAVDLNPNFAPAQEQLARLENRP